jgi:hypothetical protein
LAQGAPTAVQETNAYNNVKWATLYTGERSPIP